VLTGDKIHENQSSSYDSTNTLLYLSLSFFPVLNASLSSSLTVLSLHNLPPSFVLSLHSLGTCFSSNSYPVPLKLHSISLNFSLTSIVRNKTEDIDFVNTNELVLDDIDLEEYRKLNIFSSSSSQISSKSSFIFSSSSLPSLSEHPSVSSLNLHPSTVSFIKNYQGKSLVYSFNAFIFCLFSSFSIIADNCPFINSLSLSLDDRRNVIDYDYSKQKFPLPPHPIPLSYFLRIIHAFFFISFLLFFLFFLFPSPPHLTFLSLHGFLLPWDIVQYISSLLPSLTTLSLHSLCSCKDNNIKYVDDDIYQNEKRRRLHSRRIQERMIMDSDFYHDIRRNFMILLRLFDYFF
jgi:hypothetical protein